MALVFDPTTTYRSAHPDILMPPPLPVWFEPFYHFESEEHPVTLLSALQDSLQQVSGWHLQIQMDIERYRLTVQAHHQGQSLKFRIQIYTAPCATGESGYGFMGEVKPPTYVVEVQRRRGDNLAFAALYRHIAVKFNPKLGANLKMNRTLEHLELPPDQQDGSADRRDRRKTFAILAEMATCEAWRALVPLVKMPEWPSSLDAQCQRQLMETKSSEHQAVLLEVLLERSRQGHNQWLQPDVVAKLQQLTHQNDEWIAQLALSILRLQP